MKKATVFLSLLLALFALQGCSGGGGSSSSASTVRLINDNLTGVSLDLWTGSSQAAATLAASGIPYAIASSGVGVGTGNSYIGVVNHGGSASLAPFYFSGGYNYSMLAHPLYPTGMQVEQLVENQATPASGSGLLGVVDYSGAGSLDAYVILGSAAPVGTPIPLGTQAHPVNGGYSQLPIATGSPTASYRIQVTGHNSGPNNDVRLDIPAATIGNQQVLTLALTPTVGGVLVDGMLILQQNLTPIAGQKIVTAYKNGSARVRVAASNAAVTTTAPIVSSPGAGSLSAYVPVPLFGGNAATPQSGTPTNASQALTVSMNGGAITSCNTNTAVPGQDITLLVVNGACYLVADDNTLAPASYGKLRLVNGAKNSPPGGFTLTDGGLYSQGAATIGTAASAVQVPIPGGSPNALLVSPSTSGSALGSPALQQFGVYSVLLLGDYSTAASAVLSTDHIFIPW